MRYRYVPSVTLAVLCVALASSVALAQARDTTVRSASSDPDIDATAVDALGKMGDYLRTLKTFQVQATVTTEDVLNDGQKIQMMNTVDLLAERPNKLRAKVSSDRKERMFYYDGGSFTLFAPISNFYATVPAPATIEELADLLEDKYDIELPFVDLFKWGTPESGLKMIKKASDVGPSVIDGITCEQYAFRQDGLDWQIWIQNGDYPLPRRIVLTTTTDEARPQHTTSYQWNLAPSFSKDAFVFDPKDANKITLVDVIAERTGEKKAGGPK